MSSNVEKTPSHASSLSNAQPKHLDIYEPISNTPLYAIFISHTKPHQLAQIFVSVDEPLARSAKGHTEMFEVLVCVV